MSKKTDSPLHIEWSPGLVRSVNIVTGVTAEADSIQELGPILTGHRQALVGIARNLVFVKALRLPKASPSDLRNILGVQVGTLFPLSPDQISFDFLQTSDISPEGTLTIVAAVRSEDIRQLLAELKQANLTATRILPISLAAPAVAQRSGVSDGLVVERSPHGVALDVVQNKTLRFSRVIPVSSNLAVEAKRTLAAARATDGPVVAVGNVDFPGATSSQETTLSLLHQAPQFHFELMQDRALAIKRRVAARTRLAVLMMLSAILLVALVWSDRQDEMAVVTRSQGRWARELTTLRSIQSTETATAAKVAGVSSALDTAFEPSQPLSDITSVVSDSLPANAWLTGLSVQRGKAMEVRGTAKGADDVATFVSTLGANPRFRNVKLVFANSATVANTTVVQFNVSADCVGNLSMPAPDKTAVGFTRSSSSSASTAETGAGG